MFSFLSTAWSTVSSLFGGSSSKAILWLSIGLGIALLLCWGLWLRGSLAQAEANVAALQTAYSASREALLDLQAAKERQDAALAAREATINELNARSASLQARKAKAVSRDAEYAAWRAAGTPTALRELHQ